MIGQIATETGWSIDYILDKVNVVTLQLMMADMPRWISPKKYNIMDQIRSMDDRGKQRIIHEKNKNTKGMNPMEFFGKYAIKD